ncbi:DNA ligase D [Aeribacillus pallidus]|uniref:DNA ligase D n=1 Tax=Aeribacillus TaxID=1055323 RepID=UPI0007B46796|nr:MULTISPECIES: DNA ligase D [Aeribacillus]KZM53870.1 hypothetical protein A3Q35_02305 [Aeribacillus pallidus]MED0652229.1 DNA ligase D [Aeribacillus composti]MED4488261.1 DNA ligase D [Aeribacillus pallidus]
MQPMMPTLSFHIPEGEQWLYEPKYDGFRAILQADEDRISLMSRNGNDLSPSFPEIKHFIERQIEKWRPFFPLVLDGELVMLKTAFSADVASLKRKWKRKSDETTEAYQLLVFDILLLQGEDITKKPLSSRKELLSSVFQQLGLPLHVSPENPVPIQMIQAYHQFSQLWEKIVQHDGEGVVCKHMLSTYENKKRTSQWLKIKNFKEALFFVTGFDSNNGYMHISVHHKGTIVQAGVFSHGMPDNQKQALLEIIKKKGKKENHLYTIEPAICMKVRFLSIDGGSLREPSFHSFALEHDWTDCTFLQLKMAEANVKDVAVTHIEKPLWPKHDIQKQDFLLYLLEISDYMLPFLKDRPLTVIRYPHGLLGEAFFQKNCPDYAPEFIQTKTIDGIHYIICNDKKTLMWLGNQLAIEFHIPFNTWKEKQPAEIVFDLDPPSKNEFHLAIYAANKLKECLDRFEIASFPKLSGNKGIQVHIPIGTNIFSYEETRRFTSFFANYLAEQHPNEFTIERLKKKRGSRLYIDFLQHAEGKTIISPYSVRGNENGTVAAPLHWNEVNEQLDAESFTMDYCINRVKSGICPMKHYFSIDQHEKIKAIVEHLL